MSSIPPEKKQCVDGGKPSLEAFIRRFIIDDPFTSDETKDGLMAGYLIGRLEEGDTSFLDNKDEDAARLIEDVQIILSTCATSMREQLVAGRAHRYFAMKRSLAVSNQPSAPTPKKRPLDLKPEPLHLHPAPLENAPASIAAVVTNLALPTGTHSQACSKPPPRKIWIPGNVTDTRTYRTLAHCKEDLGPCLVIKRTKVASPLVPPYHCSYDANCCVVGCPFRCLIVSCTAELSSPNATYHQYQAHTHQPYSWMDWYQHRLRHSTSRSMKFDGRFPVNPGLPPMVKMQVDLIIGLDNKKPASNCYKQWMHLHSDSEWLAAGRPLREIFHNQFVNHVKQLRKAMGAKGIGRVEFFGDIGKVIRDHAVDWQRLEELVSNGEYKSEPKCGDEHLKTFASVLKAKHVFRTLKSNSDRNAHWEAIVLDADCVVQDGRWKELHGAPDAKHKTGPDPRYRTLVLTSYTLLHNLVHARNAGWNISASIDGTHKVSNTSYILHVVGVNGIGKTGHRSFYPVAYGFGEGEREIVALHTILNVKYAAAKLFGVVDIKFNGGVVSDRSNALVNACSYCFPDTPMLQCYTHIVRKFKAAGGREGNGGYVHHLKSNDSIWLNKVAQQDVRQMHQCKTLEQFLLMWSLVRRAWESAGEVEMAKTFNASYVADPLFRNWYYTVSGIPGCVPDNNPVEAHNKLTKGSHNFDGYCIINTNLRSAISHELPSLIRHASEARREPPMEIAVLEFEHIYNKEQTTEWLKRFDFNIDVKPFRDNNGYLVNDVCMLSVPITEEDIEEMRRAEQGTLDVCVEDRSKLVGITKRFHKIGWVRSATNPEHVACDCMDYYLHRWCFPSFYFQHMKRLKIEGQKIPTNGRTGKKASRNACFRHQMQDADVRIRHRKDEETATRLSVRAGADVGPVTLTQD